MDELYVPCPRCGGTRFVTAIIRPGNGFIPSQSGYFACDLCHGTGEADAARAAEFIADQVERLDA